MHKRHFNNQAATWLSHLLLFKLIKCNIIFYRRKNEVITDDPFAKRTSPENGKRHHPRNNREGFPEKADADQTWQTYKPFVYGDDEKG